MSAPFLIGENMTGGYGAVDILHSCTLAVEPGEIAVIVGPNGAGKSTAMKAVFGMLKLRQGSVKLMGEDITSLTPQARVRKGMGFVPQTHNIFTGMTVEENLEMGAFMDVHFQAFCIFTQTSHGSGFPQSCRTCRRAGQEWCLY